MSRLLAWLRLALWPSSTDASLDEELRACVELLAADKVRLGVAPERAKREALMEIGGIEQVKEEVRSHRPAAGIGPLWYDTRAAFRMMRRNPVLSLTSIALVALSISLTCTTYAVLDAVVLRRLPVSHPDQLVLLSEVRPDQPTGRGALTWSLFEELGRRPHGATQLFGFSGLTLAVTMEGVTRGGSIFGVTGDYFSALGARSAIGRLFGPEEQGFVAVISHRLWQNQYSADPLIVGRHFLLGNTPVQIVGVASAEFVGTQPDSTWDAVMPYRAFQMGRGATAEQVLTGRVETGARLPEGLSSTDFAARLTAIWPSIVDAAMPPGAAPSAWRQERGTTVEALSLATGLSYLKQLQPALAQAIMLTFWLAVLVWIATCFTIALLAVARAVKLQSQTAIMYAVGGTRLRVLRPYAVEAVAIAVIGGASGLLLASWLVDLAAWFTPGGWRIEVDAFVVGVAIANALGAAALGASFGAVLAARVPAESALQHDPRVARPHLGIRTWLLSVQFGVAVILLTYALVHIGELSALARVPLGLDPERLQVHQLSGTLPMRPLDRTYFEPLLQRLRDLPGIDEVGMAGGAPPLGYLADAARPVSADEAQERALTVCAFPGYFDVLHLPIHTGRDLAWDDVSATVVTTRLASRLFPDGRVLGQTIQTADHKRWTVIGVVGDVAYSGQRRGARPVLFVPCFEHLRPWQNAYVVPVMVRSERPLADVRRDISELLKAEGVHYVYSSRYQADIVESSLKQERLLATVSGLSGGLVVTLTAVGLYGFCAYVFTFRRRELAIRAALGATPGTLGRSIVAETMRVAALGSVLGIGGIYGLGHVLTRIVVGLPQPNASGVSLAIAVMLVVVACAVVLPARGAMRFDIARVLRLG